MSKKLPTIEETPIAEINTSLGVLYLYPFTMGDLEYFENIKKENQWFRLFLSRIASLSDKKKNISKNLIEKLSEKEIEAAAEAYIASYKFIISKNINLPRNNETATKYLSDLITNDIQTHRENISQILKPFENFGKLAKSYSDLGKTVRQYNCLIDNLRNIPKTSGKIHQYESVMNPSNVVLNPEISENYEEDSDNLEKISSSQNILHTTNKSQVTQAVFEPRPSYEQLERQESVLRNIEKMNSQSASVLLDLSDMAKNMLAQMEQRNIQTNKDTRNQINIAFWSLIISAAVSSVSLLYTINNDEWQDLLLSEVKKNTQELENIKSMKMPFDKTKLKYKQNISNKKYSQRK